MQAVITQWWRVECYRDGRLVWTEVFPNLVVLEGRNTYLDRTLKTGVASPTWYVGLIAGPGSGNTYAASDTMASHPGWTEFTGYSGNRPQWIAGTVANGSVDNAAQKATFTMTSGGTLAGAFMASDPTRGGTTGLLLGEGNFSSGDRSVVANDVVQVTVTCTMASA